MDKTIYLDDNAMIKDNKFYVLKYDSKHGIILTPVDCIVYYDIVKNIIIDTINKDGLTSINKKTYEQVTLENEYAVVMDIERACKMIDDKMIKKYAPNVVEGVSKLSNWAKNL